jgi:hypothetical protein
MNLSPEHLRHIEAIKSDMTCPKNFECQQRSFRDFPMTRPVGHLLECLEDCSEDCPFAIKIVIGRFCRCPLNRYIHNFGKSKAVY